MYFIGLIIQYSSDTEKAVELPHWGDPFEIAIKRCSRDSLSFLLSEDYRSQYLVTGLNKAGHYNLGI